jgi:hypothetical protein
VLTETRDDLQRYAYLTNHSPLTRHTALRFLEFLIDVTIGMVSVGHGFVIGIAAGRAA